MSSAKSTSAQERKKTKKSKKNNYTKMLPFLFDTIFDVELGQICRKKNLSRNIKRSIATGVVAIVTHQIET